MKKWFKTDTKLWKRISVSVAVIALFLLVPEVTQAATTWQNAVATFLGAFVSVALWILGKVLVVLFYLVIWVAQYNDFINSPAVSTGWVIVRDICNMFFILILLIIAFATILNVEKYSWKNLLPKLLIMAVLINFSKLICGVIIDVAQVVMLTFVNGFRDIAGGNFGSMTGIQNLLNINGSSPEEISTLSIAGTYILAVLYVLVSIVVITVILFVLVIRIVMLWILVVLSPLAYLLRAAPLNKDYAGDWWSQFTNNVVSGPILAFFIWLSFATMQGQTAQSILKVDKPDQGADESYYTTITDQAGQGGQPVAGLADAGTPEGMLRFVISIGLLVGGLMITKQLGGAIGDIAGKGMGSISKGASGIKNFGATAAKNVGRAGAQTSLRGAGASTRWIGNKLNTKFGGKAGETFQKSGQFLQSWGTDIRKTRKEEKVKKRKATLEKLGMKEQTMNYGKEALDTQAARAIKGGLTTVAGLAMMSNPATAAGGVALLVAGTAQLGGGLGGKFIGKAFKEDSYRQQRADNIESSDSALEKINKKREKEKESAFKDYSKPFEDAVKKREKGRDRDLQSVEDQLKSDIRNAKNSNASEADINKLYQVAQGKRVKINTEADIDIDKLKTEFNERSKDKKFEIEAKVNAKYEPMINEINQFKKQNQLAQRRERQITSQENTRSSELGSLETERRNAILHVKDLYKDAPTTVREQKIAEKNQEFEANKAKINEKHDYLISAYKRRTSGINETKLDGVIPKTLHGTGKALEGISPNKLTIEAMKLGSKEFEHARETVESLASSNVFDFPVSTWSGPMGINSQQEKILGELGNNSKDSNKAIQNIISTLPLGSMSKKEHVQKLEAMMKGIAHIKSKKPETTKYFATLISEFEKLHPNNKKVDDFKPKNKK